MENIRGGRAQAPAGRWLRRGGSVLALLCCAACSDSDEPPREPGSFGSVALLAGAIDAGGAGDRDGIGPAARFDGPTGLAVASDGAVWVSELTTGRLRRIDAQRRVHTVLDLDALAPGSVEDGPVYRHELPRAMAAGPQGEVYVAATESAKRRTAGGSLASDGPYWVVLRVAPDGSHRVVVRAPSAWADALSISATGLVVDRTGRLFIADGLRCSLWRAEPAAAAEAPPVAPTLVHAERRSGQGGDCATPGLLVSTAMRVAVDADDQVHFTTRQGELRRLAADGSSTLVARVPNTGIACGVLAADAAGRWLVTDGASTVWAIDDTGPWRHWAGTPSVAGWADGPRASARFAQACGLAVAPNGDVFVTDAAAHTVRRIDPGGEVSTHAGLALQAGFRDASGAAALFGPYLNLATGADGQLLVADPDNRVVRSIDPAGAVRTVAGRPARTTPYLGQDGPPGVATVGWVSSVALAGDGSLWIGELGLLRRRGSDGGLRSVAPLPAGLVLDMAVDPAGDLVVAAGDVAYGIDGQASTTVAFVRQPAAGQAGPVPLPLNWPAELAPASTRYLPGGLCVAADGAIHFSFGHAVLRRTRDGRVGLWAGSVDETGSADGGRADARFRWPRGLACGADGGLHVADADNHTVRYIDPQGRVRTVLGRAGERGAATGAAPGLLDTPRALARLPDGLAVLTGLGVVVARP